MLLYLLVRIKRMYSSEEHKPFPTEPAVPAVTVVVAAYNEEDWIEEKIENSLRLNYPKDKLQLLFVTDGSTDRTKDIVQRYPSIQCEHQPERRGKIAAVERVMPLIRTPITVYTDANTSLNPEAINCLARHFGDPTVGAVAGEKRIRQSARDDASTAGEGIYWRYESWLKQLDSELHSVVGAAGELFAIRTQLYESVPSDTLIEDFYMTLRIAQRGYRVAYEKEASASENSSASVREEMKRKIRITAGGIQAIIRLSSLLWPFRNPLLTFQYVSHRVLRWTLAPLALGVLLVTSIWLASQNDFVGWLLLSLQLLFYAGAYVGYCLQTRAISAKLLYVPFYFTMMNLTVYLGAWRLLKGKQSVVWEKAQRKL
jgi:cellulose synthase/poly-beta-1,6-N-acetylglucosamine synthase-like glycosyltransferase